MKDYAKAQLTSRILIESLPYIKKFHGEIVVIKYGGHAMKDEELGRAFAQNIALLKYVGLKPVIVHGGGPQIGQMLDALNITCQFREGHRVTDEATMDVVEMVLVGKVNKEIVNKLNMSDCKAVGLSGKDGTLLRARKLRMVASGASKPPELIDLGKVGEVVGVESGLLTGLLAEGYTPVIAPVGVDAQGNTYNINADSVAGAVAGALRAKRLLLLTDVAGILDANKNLLEELTIKETLDLFEDGTLQGGMIPKVKCCLDAINDGVARATILDGRVENSVLLELFTNSGIGTQILGNK